MEKAGPCSLMMDQIWEKVQIPLFVPHDGRLRLIWSFRWSWDPKKGKNVLFYVTVLRFIGIRDPIRISSTFGLFDSRFKT